MSETQDNECLAVSSRKKNASQFMNFASSFIAKEREKRREKKEGREGRMKKGSFRKSSDLCIEFISNEPGMRRRKRGWKEERI